MQRGRPWVWAMTLLWAIPLCVGCGVQREHLMEGRDGADVPASESAQASYDDDAGPWPQKERAPSPSPPSPPARSPMGAKADTSADAPRQPEPESSSAVSRPLLIYSAHVHLAVFETQKTLAAARQLVAQSGGYLVQQSDRRITFRVPAARFEETLESALALGDVVHREIKAEDVTAEFFDIETRLGTLEATRARLEQLMARAADVEEALAVERELGRVIGEIEQLKGRLKLLRELHAFSTITLELQPRVVETLDTSVRLPFPWLRSLGLGELLSL